VSNIGQRFLVIVLRRTRLEIAVSANVTSRDQPRKHERISSRVFFVPQNFRQMFYSNTLHDALAIAICPRFRKGLSSSSQGIATSINENISRALDLNGLGAQFSLKRKPSGDNRYTGRYGLLERALLFETSGQSAWLNNYSIIKS